MDKGTLLTAIVGGVVSVVTYLAGSKSKIKKENAEAEGIHINNVDEAIQIWRNLVTQLQSDLNVLKKEVREWEEKFRIQEEKIKGLQKENYQLHIEVDSLRRQIS